MEIKSLPDLRTYKFDEVAFNELMQKRIYKVLIVCSNYDYYMLEEDGRIDQRIFHEYTALNLRYPPSFLHASSIRGALKILSSDSIDLVITWLDIGNYKAFETSKKIKENFPNVPIVALSNSSSELRKKLENENKSLIDFVFHWNGNLDIFFAIVKLVEDRMNAEHDINEIGVKAILLVEDSLKFYSRYLPLIYKILLNLFLAVKSIFPIEWENHNKFILSKTTGYGALLKAFPNIYELGLDKKSLDIDFFKSCLICFKDYLEEEELELTSSFFPSNGQGQKKLAEVIELSLQKII